MVLTPGDSINVPKGDSTVSVANGSEKTGYFTTTFDTIINSYPVDANSTRVVTGLHNQEKITNTGKVDLTVTFT